VINKWNVVGGFTYCLPLDGGDLSIDPETGEPEPTFGLEYFQSDPIDWAVSAESTADATPAGETAWFWYPV
jgi:hypothetical protein